MLEGRDIYQQRISRAQDEATARGIDVLLLVDRENHIYFAGVTQIECMALLIPRRGLPVAITLWLDAPYVKAESAIEDVRGYLFPREDLTSRIVGAISEMDFDKPVIGFERYFVSFGMFDGLRKGLPESQFSDASGIIYKIRSRKTPGEIAFMQWASDIVRKGMEAAQRFVKPGVREVEVLAEAEYAMRRAGAEGFPFRAQVTSGDRALLTHPYASDAPIVPGQPVIIHIGASVNGYCSKMCRTVAVGDIPEAQKRVYAVLVEAQSRAIAALKPGNTVREVDAAARRVVEEAGYGRDFIDDTGHGIGLRQSEFYPVIGRNRSFVIEEGMVVDLLLPTIHLKGAGGPRVTDIIHVAEDGPRVLTEYSRELLTV